MLKRVIDILGWLGVALVLAAVLTRAFKPELVDVWRNLALAGLVVVLVYVGGQWREIAEAFGRRQTRYGALSAASIVIVLAILAGLNYIATRQSKRWDLSAAKQFSLSDQTQKVLESLEQPLEIQVFSRNERFREFRDRLGEFQHASKQVQVSYVDVDREPSRARQNQITALDTVLIKYGDRSERAIGSGESELVNAIVKAVEGKTKKVFFVQGHREKDPSSADERLGYNGLATAMGRDNFTVEKLQLAQQADVPADADVVVIAGPQVDYLPQEVAALKRYVEKGGTLLALLDPPDRADTPPLTNLLAFLQEWGFGVGGDIVLDPVGQAAVGSPEVPIASYPPHPIVDSMNVLTGFPLTQSVSIAPGAGRNPQPFLETSRQSFTKKDVTLLTKGGEVALDESKGDKPGPITIAAAVSADAPNSPAPTPDASNPMAPLPPKTQARIAVIGDSDFAANGFVGFGGNRDLSLNVINWLAGQESLISVRPRDPEDRRITLPANGRSVAMLVAAGLPLLCFGFGILTWWRRR